MVWWCEDCMQRVDVCAEIQGNEVFSADQSREDIFRSLAEERNLCIQCEECYSNRVVWKEMPIRLPVFKGYTVDARLKEFRKADTGRKKIEFVPFDSRKGKKLLEEMRREKR